MATGDEPSPVYESVSEKVGERAADAFAVLGNETRLAILLTLWEAYDPTAGENALSFSELRNGVGIRDSGQFNYHLDKLTGHFVYSTEDGYELAQAGHNIVQTVLGDVGNEEPELEPDDAALPCPNCGSPLHLSYENRRLSGTCSACAPHTDDTEADEATLLRMPFPPAGVVDRTAEEVLLANSQRAFREVGMRASGVCPQCAGVVDTWFDVCEDHNATEEQVCSTCSRHSPVRVWLVCTVCKDYETGPPSIVLQTHPTSIQYMKQMGYPFDMEAEDTPDAERFRELFGEMETTEEVISTEPLRVRSTMRDDTAGTISGLFNEDVELLDIEWER